MQGRHVDSGERMVREGIEMRGSSLRPVFAACALQMLVACGGGIDDAPDAAHGASPTSLASPAPLSGMQLARADTRRTALALGPNDPVDANHAFDWAEWKFPELFPKGPASVQINHLGVAYTVRAYSTGNYLGVTANGDIYGLGPFTGNLLVPLGSLSAFEPQIRADRCSVYPGSCAPTVLPGSNLNECQPLTTQSLVTGTRMRAEYAYSGAVTGTQVLEIDVGGTAIFANQNTIQLTMVMTTSSPVLGNSTTTTRFFLQDAGGGLVRTIGDEESITSQGFTRSTRSVFDPQYLNSEFTLARGASFVRTTTWLETPIQPPGTPMRLSETKTLTFVTRESIVVGGRTYDTCRYTEQSASAGVTTLWYHVGTGIPVRISAGGGLANADLTAATINNAPL